MMKNKTWYFGPTSDLDMFGDDEYSSWVWIADNPDGLLDDSHITDYIEAILPPGFCEQCESIFNHTSNSYDEVRNLLVEAGFVEARCNSNNSSNDDDDEDDDGDEDDDDDTPVTRVGLKNAPETLDAAIERIRVLEQALDNVCYTMEIASVTGNYSHARPYVTDGLSLLENRIVDI
jgi:hypothetical protein